MKITENVIYILKELKKTGFEGYVVGGCVRDFLMGGTPHDYDITTNALPADIKAIFKRTVDTGIKHGTVTVLLGGESFEVTTYRIDGGYKDGRHPDEVTFTDDITKDLSRRDFTMNAIAYSPETGYVDPFGGISDIKSKIIRGVREPNLRFGEDALRMLRCLRFSAQLGFEIEEATYEALKNNAELIENVSAERVAVEFLRLITSDFCEKILLMRETGLAKYCIPEAYKALGERGEEIAGLLKAAKKDEETALAIVFAKAADPEAALKALKLSNALIKGTMKLIKYYDFEIGEDKFILRSLLSELGRESLEKLFGIKAAKGENVSFGAEFIKSERELSRKDLDINGREIAALGFKGEEIGKAIDRLFELVLKEPENNKKDILLKEAVKWLR